MNMSKYGRMVRQTSVLGKKYNVELEYPAGTVVLHKGSCPSVGFMWALQFITKDPNPAAMSRISKVAGRADAPYWQSLMSTEQDYMASMLEYLMVYPETTNAVMSFEEHSLVSPYHLLSLQFFIKGHTLNAIATLSTADVNEEIPNTITFVSMLIKVLANLCSLSAGTVILHIGIVTTSLPPIYTPFSDKTVFGGVPHLESLQDYMMWADEIVNNEGLIDLCGLFVLT